MPAWNQWGCDEERIWAAERRRHVLEQIARGHETGDRPRVLKPLYDPSGAMVYWRRASAMADQRNADVTRLLHEWQAGDRAALDRLIPLVYSELHALASRQLAGEWRHNRLQTTAVVSEAYMRLFGQRGVDWQNRGHFFAIAAQLMRRILVDHARRERRVKRGGDGIPLTLDDAAVSAPAPLDPVDALDLDRALQKLEQLDSDAARMVELRFFAGLTLEETAAALDVSVATVKREWMVVKGWLYRELTGDPLQ